MRLNDRQRIRTRKQAQPPRVAGPVQIQPLQAKSIPLNVNLPQSDGDVSDWLRYLDEMWRTAASDSMYLASMQEWITRMLHVCANWDEPARTVWLAVTHLFIIRKVSIPAASMPNYLQHGFRRFGQDSLDEILRLVQEMQDSDTHEMTESQIRSLNAFLRSMVVECNESFGLVLNTAMLLWDHWLQREIPLLDEISYWETQIGQRNSEEGTKLGSLQVLYTHLCVLANDDDTAIRVLGEPKACDADYHLFNLHYLCQEEAWARMQRWLHWLSIHTDYPGYMIMELCELWLMVAQHEPASLDECSRFLRGTMPLSRQYFTQFLLNTHQYRAWAEHHLALGSMPVDVDANQLKQVGKEAPDALLPLYHQAVERYVRMKNRDAYKLAVRFMAKLPKFYKKLKRQSEWDQFLVRFLARHARLRALHEEMRKRRLIT